jgi:hypothetical protein
MKTLLGVVLGCLLLLHPPSLSAADGSPAASIGPAGEWHVAWTEPTGSGSLYEANMSLVVDRSNMVQGEIFWTLRDAQRADMRAVVGRAAVEYVRGSYDPMSGVLVFEGYAKDDPSNVIGLDGYRLLLSENGNALAGVTRTGGTWQGVLYAYRK